MPRSVSFQKRILRNQRSLIAAIAKGAVSARRVIKLVRQGGRPACTEIINYEPATNSNLQSLITKSPPATDGLGFYWPFHAPSINTAGM